MDNDKRLVAVACELALRVSTAYDLGLYDPDSNTWATSLDHTRHMEWITGVCLRLGVTEAELDTAFIRLVNGLEGGAWAL
jgi:hypothetical protein